jgi:hypothetical protein
MKKKNIVKLILGIFEMRIFNSGAVRSRFTLIFEAFIGQRRYFHCPHWSNAKRQA